MSKTERVKQWCTFARTWWLFDASWQNPIDSAKVIDRYLKGMHKPIYHPMEDCGDHVVIINSKDVAFPGQEWRWRMYFHHSGYSGGASYTRAYEVHDRDYTTVMRRAVYHQLRSNLQRRYAMQRLHVFADSNVPEEIMRNVTDQIPALRPVPKKLDKYSEEERSEYPKVVDYPVDYIPR